MTIYYSLPLLIIKIIVIKSSPQSRHAQPSTLSMQASNDSFSSWFLTAQAEMDLRLDAECFMELPEEIDNVTPMRHREEEDGLCENLNRKNMTEFRRAEPPVEEMF